jgi:2-polyprenyl-3-methyl-5-hydroxy-6-metoxy-1,4-benzoquinol methylase
MAATGDLTSANYWEKEWAASGVGRDRLAPMRTISQWKFDRMICQMLNEVPNARAEVLELGCAPGSMLQRIHRLRPQLRLSGIDYAEEGAKTTAAILGSLGLPMNVHVGDVRTLDLPTKFDLVTSFGLIEHFDDPAEIIRCHGRFCRPGGTVAITVPNFTSPVVKFFSSRFCADNLAIHNLQIMNLAALKTAMEAAGLQDVRVGGDGGTQMHLVISRQDILSRAFAVAGRVWNAGAVLVPPQWGWNSYLWAIGKKVG